MSTLPMTGDFIRESLELHLFWARIIKEHLIFLESGFMCKDADWMQEADALKCRFEEILHEANCLADGKVGIEVMKSGELFTNKTLKAEQKTQELTCIPINSQLTVETMSLHPYMGVGMGMVPCEQEIAEQVYALNEKALACAGGVYEYTERALKAILQCCITSHNFPSLYEHQMKETEMYMKQIRKLQNHQYTDPTCHMVEMQMFWDHIMQEHAEVISHLLDPKEKAMITQADHFAQAYEQLLNQLGNGTVPDQSFRRITNETIRVTGEFKDFKAAGTDAILCCQLRSLILPLLADHVLREAIHYLRILGLPLPEFKGGKG
ncbi:DUF2935 domain-containing protein [Desulfitobacterium chlororespirans]|uniref:DUF2935 domain-containing protein n=1 Tax=Desulfitobacterium chlororespirans DSM 11544 TaxID=1121395 RepID=A0A1M7T3C7_9FIRM|nr:DUF2935 domain-containing protein [Desulfitobacterium chlororespirans]SHN65221.1 protein of unknown function [Desulfitobacterium chlororespirans DSM 11544]